MELHEKNHWSSFYWEYWVRIEKQKLGHNCYSSVASDLSWKSKLYFIFSCECCRNCHGELKFYCLHKCWQFECQQNLSFSTTVNFELLIGELLPNPPNLWYSFSVICMPSQSSTETSRVIVSFPRDAILECESIPGGFFVCSFWGIFSARNELTDVKSCSFVNICQIEISLRRSSITNNKIGDACCFFWFDCNNIASFSWYHKAFCILWFLHVIKDYVSWLMEYFQLFSYLALHESHLAMVCSALAQALLT